MCHFEMSLFLAIEKSFYFIYPVGNNFAMLSIVKKCAYSTVRYLDFKDFSIAKYAHFEMTI